MEILQNVVSPFWLNITGKEERFMDLKMIKDHFNLPDKSYKELARHLRLVEVKEDELPALHEMQVKSFMPLYEKYHDECSPAIESIDRIKARFAAENRKYYFITMDGARVGVINIGNNDPNEKKISFIIDVLIVIFVAVGTVIMFNGAADETGLSTSGLYNLKYFTVLSNEFCGIVTIVNVIRQIAGKRGIPQFFDYMAVTAVGLTFAVIVFFLQPLYREMNLYQGGNLYFHLIVPVIAMCRFVLFSDEDNDDKLPFKSTFIAAIPSIIYGFGYLINILINGIGEWPDTNDWYGFLNWGYPVGVGIFAGVVLINWIVALIIRGLYLLVRKNKLRSE